MLTKLIDGQVYTFPNPAYGELDGLGSRCSCCS